MSQKFLGSLQVVSHLTPVSADEETLYHAETPPLAFTGLCDSYKEAQDKMRKHLKEKYPEKEDLVDDAHCVGGLLIYDEDMTIYELIEKAADDNSKRLIEKMYAEAIELV